MQELYSNIDILQEQSYIIMIYDFDHLTKFERKRL